MASVHAVTITADAAHAGVERFCGFSIRDDSSAACVVQFRATDGSGQILLHLALAADESATLRLPADSYIEAPGGVYVNEVSGSIEGILYSADF